MINKIMLLGSGELGKEFVIAAKRLGQYVIACDSYDNAPAMQVADGREIFSMLDGDALTKAVEKAKEKGEVLAKAADGSLGEILSVSEGYQNTAYRYNTSYMDAKQMSGYGVAEEAAMDVAVMPGEAEITAQVTVVFELD